MIDIFDVSESVKRLSSEEVQKQQWMAETMGGFHQFLPFLFQNISGIVFFMIPCIYLWTKNYRKQSFDIYIVYTQCKTSEIFREFEIELFQIHCGHSIVTASNS